MMKARCVRPLLVVGALLAATGCDSLLEPRDHTYDGPPVVEFAPVLPDGTYTLSVSFAAASTETRAVTARVQYVGSAPEREITGEFTVGDGSTGVEGTHFTIPGGKRFTIAAGSNHADIPVQLHGAALEPGETVTIVLELVPGDEIGVSENYKRFTIRAGKETG